MISNTDPDPRTVPDDAEDASNEGASAQTPAEGANDDPPENDGSPKG